MLARLRVAVAMVFLVSIGLVLPATLSAQADSVIVDVVGNGASLWAARADAVRQALASAVSQLVIADRRVEGSEIVRDDVASTVNGFVRRFEQLDAEKINDEWVIKARVVVGASQIANYIARPAEGTRSTVDGRSIIASMQQAEQQRIANFQIVESLFDGYPHAVVNVKLDSLSPVPNNGTVRLFYSAWNDSGFVNRLISVGRAVTPASFKPTFMRGCETACVPQVAVVESKVFNYICIELTSIESCIQQQQFVRGQIFLSPFPQTQSPEISAARPRVLVRTSNHAAEFRVCERLLTVVESTIAVASGSVGCEITLPASFFEDATSVSLDLARPTEFNLGNIDYFRAESELWLRAPFGAGTQQDLPANSWVSSRLSNEVRATVDSSYSVAFDGAYGSFLRAWTEVEVASSTVSTVIDSLIVSFLLSIEQRPVISDYYNVVQWSVLENGTPAQVNLPPAAAESRLARFNRVLNYRGGIVRWLFNSAGTAEFFQNSWCGQLGRSADAPALQVFHEVKSGRVRFADDLQRSFPNIDFRLGEDAVRVDRLIAYCALLSPRFFVSRMTGERGTRGLLAIGFADEYSNFFGCITGGGCVRGNFTRD